MVLFLLSCLSFVYVKKIEKSTFHLQTPTSYGSGNFIDLEGRTYAVTAYHNMKEQYMINSARDSGVDIKRLSYANPVRDIIIFEVKNVKTGVSYKPHKNLKEGLEVQYWCSPGNKLNRYFKGYISKVRQGDVLVQGYAWMGCSGGLVFDMDGGLIGLVTGISIKRDKQGGIVLAENEVYISLIEKKDFYGG